MFAAFNSDKFVPKKKIIQLANIARHRACTVSFGEERNKDLISGKGNRDENDSADSSLNRSFRRIGYQVREIGERNLYGYSIGILILFVFYLSLGS